MLKHVPAAYFSEHGVCMTYKLWFVFVNLNPSDVVPRGALPRLEAASRQNFHCLGLGLGLEP